MKTTKAKNIISLIISLLLFACFLSIAILVACKHTFYIDKFLNFVSHHRTKAVVNFLKVFTHLGSIYVLIVITILFLIFTKHKKDGIFALFNLSILGVLCVTVKYIVRRVRPQDIAVIKEIGYSFPSAHAVLSVAVYTVLIYFACKYLKNKPLKIFLSTMIVIIVLVITFSRAYLGVHFVSDLIAGLLLGLSITILNIIIYNKILAKIYKHN